MALYRTQPWWPRPLRWLPPTKPTPLAGLDFHLDIHAFTQRTGLAHAAVGGIVSADLNVRVETLAWPPVELFHYTETTGTDAKLTRKTHPSLVAGTSYLVSSFKADMTQAGVKIMVAT